jgi:hypothetical protein
MYPKIKPRLKIESTISHPLQPEKVVGFHGRSQMIGEDSIIMKEEAVDGDVVNIPTEPAEELAAGNGVLVVLKDDSVYAIQGSDFAMEHQLTDVNGGGSSAEVYSLSLSMWGFRKWDRSSVEISN